MTLRSFIIQHRTEHKLSQRQFAERCGLSNGYISMLESGKNPKTSEPIVPKLDALFRIASGANISIDELLEMIDDIPCEIQNEFVYYKSLVATKSFLTNHESKVITAYRDKPLVQPHVDKLLDVQPEKETAPSNDDAVLSVAARGTPRTDEQFDKIFNAEDTLEKSSD